MVPLSIRSRLAVAYALGTGILLLFSFAALYRTLALRLQAQLDSQIVERMSEIRPLFIVSEGKVAWLFDRNVVEQSTASVAYAIYNQDGNYLDGSPLARVYNLAFDENSKKALDERGESWATIANRPGPSLRVRNIPLTGSDGNSYVLVVGALMDRLDEDLRQLGASMLTLGPLALILGGFAGTWLAQGALGPVSEIIRATHKISASQLDQRLPLRGNNDELDRLSLQLNEMIARLENSFEQMGQFLSNVSHELRTPLAAIRGSCEIALRTAKSEKECRDVLAANIEELDRLTRTVSDLLAFARAEAGQIALNCRQENLSELVRDAVESLRVLASERGVTLRYRGRDDLTAFVDPPHISRVFLNLLDNAIKYNKAGGAVDVSMHTEGNSVAVEFKDTGPGIPEKDLPHVFDRFYRAEIEGANSVGGTGLGLSLARWVVAAHGGRIDVKSQSGLGSSFLVWLPQNPGEAIRSEGKMSQRFAETTPADSLLASPAVQEFKRGGIMQKQIARVCYWLGVSAGAIALVWRALLAMGFQERIYYATSSGIGYDGFYKGAVLFLLVATATATYDQLNSGK